MKKGVSLLFLSLCAFVFSASQTYAAMLYMDPNQGELKRGDSVTVSVRLDTDEGECVNVVDSVITYSENIQPVDTSRGSSILSLWVEEPIIDKANRTISFAGGIPNGYCGRIAGDPRLTNNILDIVFQSPGLQIGQSESGNIASINFAPETHVLLNDGFGTAMTPQLFGSSFILAREAGDQVVNPWQESVSSDTIPPEKFSITLERTPNAFSNRYFITFNTTDKQSGIDHYEIIEEPLASKNLFNWGAETAPWMEAKSPYILEDQSLNSTIRVRAIDKAGNEYVATYIPEEDKRTLSSENMLAYAVLIGAGVLVMAALIALFVFLRMRRKKKLEIEVEEEII
jgi:hypothetical protein